MTMSPFDHQRDEELGRLLREQLSGSRPEAFLERMRLAVTGPRVMALAVAAGLLLWLGAWFSANQTTSEPGVTVASLPSHKLVNPQPPDVDEIMGVLLAGGGR